MEAAPDGNIYVIHRCNENSCAGRPEPPILKFDKSGKLLKSWGEGMFVFPHGATVDPQGNLWVTDAQIKDGKGYQVFKFRKKGIRIGSAKDGSVKLFIEDMESTTEEHSGAEVSAWTPQAMCTGE